MLGEELGTEPGDELRRLHTDALAGIAPAGSAGTASMPSLERLRLLLTEALSIITAQADRTPPATESH